jgi:hypothetical protein
LKALCQKAGLPDLTDQQFTQEGAQLYIDDLRKQVAGSSRKKMPLEAYRL